jgi:hypothetical protein
MWTQYSDWGIFSSSQDTLINGGTFVSISHSYYELFTNNWLQKNASFNTGEFANSQNTLIINGGIFVSISYSYCELYQQLSIGKCFF